MRNVWKEGETGELRHEDALALLAISKRHLPAVLEAQLLQAGEELVGIHALQIQHRLDNLSESRGKQRDGRLGKSRCRGRDREKPRGVAGRESLPADVAGGCCPFGELQASLPGDGYIPEGAEETLIAAARTYNWDAGGSEPSVKDELFNVRPVPDEDEQSLS